MPRRKPKGSNRGFIGGVIDDPRGGEFFGDPPRAVQGPQPGGYIEPGNIASPGGSDGSAGAQPGGTVSGVDFAPPIIRNGPEEIFANIGGRTPYDPPEDVGGMIGGSFTPRRRR